MQDFEHQAARCVFVGIAGTSPTAEELELIRRGVGGVIFFARNVKDPAQVAELSRTLKGAARSPLPQGSNLRLRSPAQVSRGRC